MILGLGSDIVQIPRIEQVLKRFGYRFEQRLFTIQEQHSASLLSSICHKAAFYAKRFAAKEAFAKALGTGFRHGLTMQAIGIVKDNEGKPYITLEGQAHQIFADFCNRNGTSSLNTTIHLTLTDDYPVAMATVIIDR